MGKKITVDSASLMNKGLEVIEARWLFDVPVEKIAVPNPPSKCRPFDGGVHRRFGHRPDGIADMRIPISYALSFPIG